MSHAVRASGLPSSLIPEDSCDRGYAVACRVLHVMTIGGRHIIVDLDPSLICNAFLDRDLTLNNCLALDFLARETLGVI